MLKKFTVQGCRNFSCPLSIDFSKVRDYRFINDVVDQVITQDKVTELQGLLNRFGIEGDPVVLDSPSGRRSFTSTRSAPCLLSIIVPAGQLCCCVFSTTSIA